MSFREGIRCFFPASWLRNPQDTRSDAMKVGKPMGKGRESRTIGKIWMRKFGQKSVSVTHSIHLYGIFTCIFPPKICQMWVNMPYMDPMGIEGQKKTRRKDTKRKMFVHLT